MPSPLPPDHQQPTATRRPLGGRERLIVAAMSVLAVAVAVVAIVSLASSAAPVGKGCLNATVPGPIGATFFKQCGNDARQLCASVTSVSGLSQLGVDTIERDCRRAGLPVG